MENKKVFCEHCRQNCIYVVKDVTSVQKYKGVSYKYPAKETFCLKCGNEVFDDDVEDYNINSFHKVYRDKNNIISLEDIRKIPVLYNIGKRPLSLLLGWGELTFSRYFEGDMPTKQYSDTLKKLLSDPYYYYEILENGKERLNSNLTYFKSRKTVLELIDVKKECENKDDIKLKIEKKKASDIAINLFEFGILSLKQISEATGLSENDVYNLSIKAKK